MMSKLKNYFLKIWGLIPLNPTSKLQKTISVTFFEIILINLMSKFFRLVGYPFEMLLRYICKVNCQCYGFKHCASQFTHFRQL